MKKTNTLIVILTVLVVLGAVNILAARHPLRLDLTKKHIYTLSPATKSILKGLDDIVTIRAYFTRDLPPQAQPLRRDVEDILAEFKSAAGNRLQIEFIDPGASMLEEQKVQMMGIPPVQLNVVEKDKQEVAKIYLGMAVLFGTKQQILPVVKNMDNLEYELSEAIVKVSSKELPKIAWWQPGHEDLPDGDGFNAIKDAVSRRYTITDIREKDIADLAVKNYPALVIASPRKLSEDELFSLDQYLMGGGKAIALIDRFEVGQTLNIIPAETNVEDLIEHYGVEVEDSIALDQSNAMASFAGGVVTYHMPYPYWPDIRRGQFSTSEPIVSELESVVLTWTSPLKLSTDKAVAIGSTSQISAAIPSKGAKLDPQSAGDALRNGKHEVRPLIAMLSGPFQSYFASDKVPPPKGSDVLKDGDDSARLFIVGSSRWITDRVLQTFPQNAALFQNALDSFAMGDLLIGIRSRESTSRPIAILPDGVRAALKYANLAAGPMAMVIIGLVLMMIRRSKRRMVQYMFK